jgi:hypothetical protein
MKKLQDTKYKKQEKITQSQQALSLFAQKILFHVAYISGNATVGCNLIQNDIQENLIMR